jgi:hypothetical protein
MSFKCNLCNKDYKSYQSLWNHNHKYHKEIKFINTSIPNKTPLNSALQTSQQTETNKKLIECTYCKKVFSRSDNLKRHYLTCMQKKESETENNIYLEQIKILTQRIEQLEKNQSKPQTINNFNNTINICNIGDENLKALTKEEKDFVVSHGLNSIVAMVDVLNFNERIPEHHNFYTTSINDKYANTLDKKTNSVIKQPKKDLYDKVLYSNIQNLKQIAQTSQDFLPTYTSLNQFIFNKKGKKEFHTQINALAYNKKNIVINTLSKIGTNEQQTEKNNNQSLIIEESDSDADTEFSTDSESESDGKLKSTKVNKDKEKEIEV